MMGPHIQPFMSSRFPGGAPCGRQVNFLWASRVPSPSSLAPQTPPHVLRGIRAWAQCKGWLLHWAWPALGPRPMEVACGPQLNSLGGPGLPTMNMGSRVRGPWASPSGQLDPLLLVLSRQLHGTPRRRWAPWNTHQAQTERLHPLQREHGHHHEPHWAGRWQG